MIGCRPYEFIARDYGKPVVVAGFEPLDILQSIYMLMLQLSAGRSTVENQYSRVVPVGRQHRSRSRPSARPWSCARTSSGAAWASSRTPRSRSGSSTPSFDAELLFSVPGVRVADPKACQCGEVLKGVLKPWECKVFGTACTPETPIGTCMVSPEGACAAYYNYGRLTRTTGQGGDPAMTADQQSAGWVQEALRVHDEQARGGGGPQAAPTAGSPQPLPGTVREELVLERIDRARRSRPRVKEERITMSHGAGGKATQTLIEAIFLDAFRNPLLEPLEDAARLQVGGARLALTTDSYVVSPLFFPGGDIGDLAVNGTVNDLAMSGAVPLYLSAGFILEEGFPVADLSRIVRSMRDGGRRGRRPGRHRRHQGRGEGQGRRLLHQHRRSRRHRARPGPRRGATRGRETRSSSPARSATTGSRSCWPAASWTSRPT